MKNLPITDTRYWSALFVASLAGTIFGDYISTTLNLGFGPASLSLGFLFFLVIFSETYSSKGNELYYWMAIILTRTAATNVADLATHEIRLGYIGVASCLGGVLVAILFFGYKPKSKKLKQNLQQNSLPPVNARYWAAIFVASVIGTTMGDYFSTGLELGFRNSSLILGTLLVLVFFIKNKAKSENETFYWVTILILRTAGTTIGDFISSEEGLNLGFAKGAACMFILLLCILYFGRRPTNAV